MPTPRVRIHHPFFAPPGPRSDEFRTGFRAIGVALALFGGSHLVRAQTSYYFDVNGTTAGSGATGSSYNVTASSTVWTTSSGGTGTPVAWGGTTRRMVFSAGTDATGAFSVQLSGFNASVGELTQQEGSVTLSGGDLVLGANATFAVTGTMQIQNVVGESTAGTTFTKSGAGTLTLTGQNTFTGGINVNQGTLILDAGAFAVPETSAVTVASGAQLSILGYGQQLGSIEGAGNLFIDPGSFLFVGDSAASKTFSGVISGGAFIDKVGSGTLVLGGNNTTAAAITVDAGTLAVAHANALGSTGAGTQVLSGATLDLRNVAVGNEAVTLDGGATLATSAGTSSLAGPLVLNSGDSTLSVTGSSLTLGGIASGPGGLNKDGAGTAVLGGDNTFTGSVYVNAGTLAVTSAHALGTTDNGTAIRSGATLDLRNVALGAEAVALDGGGTLATSTGVSSLGGLTLNAGDSTIAVTGTSLSISGPISGPGGFHQTGTGMLRLGSNNSYTGSTFVDGGTLAVTAAGALGTTDNGTTVNAGGRLDLQNVAVGGEAVTLANGGTLATSAGTSSLAGVVTLGSGTAAVDVGGTRLTLNGAVTGTGGLAKTGTGTLALAGANSFTGSVQVNAGILALTGVNALASAGTVTVAGGATLYTATNQSVAVLAGAGTLQLDGGTFTLGGASSIGTLHVTADSALNFSGSLAVTNFIIDAGVALTASNTFVVANWWTDAGMSTLVARNVAGTTPFNQVTIAAYPGTAGSTHWNEADTITPVPEANGYGAALVSLGLVLLGRRHRRRRRRPAQAWRTSISWRVPSSFSLLHGLARKRAPGGSDSASASDSADPLITITAISGLRESARWARLSPPMFAMLAPATSTRAVPWRDESRANASTPSFAVITR